MHSYDDRRSCAYINPLPSTAYVRRNAKVFISIQEGIVKKKSHERRDYESVDETSLS